MPNKKTGQATAPQGPSEGLQRGFQRPGSDPIPTKVVHGELTFAHGGYGLQRVKADLTDDLAPVNAVGVLGTLTEATAVSAAVGQILRTNAWLARFSGAALYLSFNNTPDAAATADIEIYRVTDAGVIIADGSFTGVKHQTLIRDANVQGMATYYRVVNAAGGGSGAPSDALTLNVAGEGLGYAAAY